MTLRLACSLSLIFASISVLFPSASLLAQPADGERSTSTYLVKAETTEAAVEGAEKRGKSMVAMTARPEFAVKLLGGALDTDLARRMAVNKRAPFVNGTMLYGWRDHPGLYCDLMRNRGLGSSTACLQDTNDDGLFDKISRYDFNSYGSELVFLTDKQKVRGGTFKRDAELADLIAYEKVDVPGDVFGKVNLLWDTFDGRSLRKEGPNIIDLYVSDGSNFTGTLILSNMVQRVLINGESKTLEAFGLEVEVTDFTEKGALEYRARQIAADVPIGFVFLRAAPIEIIFIP